VTSHLGLLVLFALMTSAIFAVIAKDAVRDQVRTGLRLFAAFVGVALVLGWLMYFIPV
jgi:galactitol-specific phosphotransferase system IIC component